MRLRQISRQMLVCTGALALVACGGGGGGPRVAAIPAAPTPTPTPTPFPVNIFPNPKPETYATVSVFADQPNIRYNPGGYYEAEFPGATWTRLAIPGNVVPQDPATFNLFQTVPGGHNVAIGLARLRGYQYSEWANNGAFAFGSATPAGSVPVTGSGNYHGEVIGSSDILQDDFLVGGKVAVAIAGSVDLQFHFGSGSLGGSMTVKTDPYVGPVDLGTFAFRDTVYSVGSPTYSGAFQTSATGQNAFLGRFTGPHAEETIGGWALPFQYSADGLVHQAWGAWIAK